MKKLVCWLVIAAVGLVVVGCGEGEPKKFDKSTIKKQNYDDTNDDKHDK